MTALAEMRDDFLSPPQDPTVPFDFSKSVIYGYGIFHSDLEQKSLREWDQHVHLKDVMFSFL